MAQTPGTYYFQASFAGDVNNKPAVSPCGSEILVVAAAPLGPVQTGVAMLIGGRVPWLLLGSGILGIIAVTGLVISRTRRRRSE